MKRNFEFDHFSVVRWGDRFIDLHNVYDLERFGTDLNGSDFQLKFQRNDYATEADKLPLNVVLSCTGNVRVAFNDLVAIAAPLNDEGIEIAYFDEECDWLSFLDEEIAQRQEPQGLQFMFCNGFAVRVFCDEATFTVSDGTQWQEWVAVSGIMPVNRTVRPNPT